MDLLDRAYSIPALAPTLDHDLPGRLLCPVRALKWYMKRTKFHRRDRRQLWLSCQLKSTKDITKSTVASWLKKTIVLTYAMAEQKTPIYGSLIPHEIQAIATSLATWKTVSVEQIVSTCQWSSQNTFTSFYLRDVAQDCVGLHSLGNLVTAQTVSSFWPSDGLKAGGGRDCADVKLKRSPQRKLWSRVWFCASKNMVSCLFPILDGGSDNLNHRIAIITTFLDGSDVIYMVTAGNDS